MGSAVIAITGCRETHHQACPFAGSGQALSGAEGTQRHQEALDFGSLPEQPCRRDELVRQTASPVESRLETSEVCTPLEQAAHGETSEVFRSSLAGETSLSGRRPRLPRHALRLPKSFIHDLTWRPARDYNYLFKRAIKMYLEYVRNPSGWKHRAGQISRRKNVNGKNATRKKKDKPSPSFAAESLETSTVTINPAGLQMMDYPFPLRESCVVRLRLPADLKVAEVERLAAFMRSVAVDFAK